jgi:hypothetical protein
MTKDSEPNGSKHSLNLVCKNTAICNESEVLAYLIIVIIRIDLFHR